MDGSQIVVDASIFLRWLMPDPLSEACLQLFRRIAAAEGEIIAPTLLVYEVVSSLTKSIYFKSISREQGRQSLAHFFALECQLVEADEGLSQRAFEWTLNLGRAASYDSYYLALAEHFNCELWTADKRLSNLARGAQIPWVHWVEDR